MKQIDCEVLLPVKKPNSRSKDTRKFIGVAEFYQKGEKIQLFENQAHELSDMGYVKILKGTPGRKPANGTKKSIEDVKK